jgi:hypothetical protein
MATPQCLTARVVWCRNADDKQSAFVYYGGRIFRMVYNRVLKVIAMALADRRSPCLIVSRHRPSVPVQGITVVEHRDTAPDADFLQRFIDRSIEIFRQAGIL